VSELQWPQRRPVDFQKREVSRRVGSDLARHPDLDRIVLGAHGDRHGFTALDVQRLGKHVLVGRHERAVAYGKPGAGETELRVAQTLESADGEDRRLDALDGRWVLREAR